MVEQRPFKPLVVGSIPTAPTSFLFHFTGLAETARQQKAALRNRAASANEQKLAVRMANCRFAAPILVSEAVTQARDRSFSPMGSGDGRLFLDQRLR